MPQLEVTDCEEVLRRLDDYLDRELGREEMERVRAHLEVCARCASELRFESSLVQELRPKLRRIAAPPALLEKIARTLAAGRAGLTRASGGGPPPGGRRGRR